MPITAKIIEDSIADNGVRLTTLQLQYPRFIHSEVLTHRVFSRNASSSRAIPVTKMLDMIATEPASPIHWGKNQPGMQAAEELGQPQRIRVQSLWLEAAQNAAETARKMMEQGAHKQVVNRILEPFQWMHVIVTATEWDNFFELRAHPDAQPEIQALAIAMKEAFAASHPMPLDDGQWHLPYITRAERAGYFDDADLLLKLSAARCARVSYLLHDGQMPSIEKDIALYERLVGSAPLHASPVEHQATPLSQADMWSGNFRGWLQYRKLVEMPLQLS
jgi:thymidylate synthase ThyX